MNELLVKLNALKSQLSTITDADDRTEEEAKIAALEVEIAKLKAAEIAPLSAAAKMRELVRATKEAAEKRKANNSTAKNGKIVEGTREIRCFIKFSDIPNTDKDSALFYNVDLIRAGTRAKLNLPADYEKAYINVSKDRVPSHIRPGDGFMAECKFEFSIGYKLDESAAYRNIMLTDMTVVTEEYLRMLKLEKEVGA